FGRALTFNGSNSWVTVPSSTSLNLKTGMTVESWVYPTAGTGAWRAVAVKETNTGLAWALYAFGDQNMPSGHAFTTGEGWATGTAKLALNTWSHIATTYDGTAIRIYVNGVLKDTTPWTGQPVTSNQPLRFGGDAVWPEWF